MDGGASRDHFMFNVYANDGSGFTGHDIINNFNVNEDTIFLVGGFSYAHLISQAVDTAQGVRLTLGANGATVTLPGLNHSNLGANNFYILEPNDAAISNPTPLPDIIPEVELGVYRFFNTSNGAHFYSANYAETTSIANNLPQFRYEGVAYKSVTGSDANAIEFFRFLNTTTGTHFFTASTAERDAVISTLPQYNYEGVGYHLHDTADSNDIALYRFFNTDTGTHFYTASEIEKDNVISTLSHYNYEGIAGYVDIA
jgi:hypothetical protein